MASEFALLKGKVEGILNNLTSSDKLANNYAKDSVSSFFNNFLSIMTQKEKEGKSDEIKIKFVDFYNSIMKIENFLNQTTKIDENNEGEIEKDIEAIEKIFNALNIDFTLEFQQEKHKNFKELKKKKKGHELGLIKSHPKKIDFINKFKSKEAAQLWTEYFPDEDTVDWKKFEGAMDSYFGKNNNKIQLNPQMKRNLREILDEHMDQKIEWKDCDNFFVKVWDNKVFRENTIFNSLNMEVVDPLANLNQTLYLTFEKYLGADTAEIKHSIPEGSVIRITPKYTEFIDSQKVTHKIEKELSRETLVFGRFSPVVQNQPDVLFDKSMKTMGKKQFQILCKDFSNESGYFITDLSRLNKTNFFIKDVPYFLNKGMVIELNCCFFHIKDIYPLPSEDKKGAYYVDTTEYKKGEVISQPSKYISDGDEDVTMKKKKEKPKTSSSSNSFNSSDKKPASKDEDTSDVTVIKKVINKVPVSESKGPEKIEGQKPFITIVPFDDEAKAAKEFTEHLKTWEISEKRKHVFLLGTDPSSHFRLGPGHFPKNSEVNQFNDFHCQIVYEPELGWTILEKAIPQQKEFSIGTHVCLKNYTKFQNDSYSDPFKLRDGMKISSAHHVFSVKIN